jgi:O-antigen/teichoic acid export membrane protein
MVVVTVTAYLVAWMDLFFVGAFRDADEVGHYALAYQLFTLVIQFAALWVTAALPYELRHAQRGGGAADRASLVWSTAAWSAAVAAVAVAVQWVVVPVMGADFEPAVAPSAMLLIAATAVSGYYAAVPRVLARQGARDVARVSGIGFVINLVLDVALIPWLGGWGAVIATGVTLFYATAALVAVDAGRRTSLTVMAAGLPAAAAIGLSVAADTPVVQGVVLAALLAGLAFSGHRAWRQRRTTTATETT